MSAQLMFSIWTHRWTQNLLWLLSDTSIGNIQTDYGVRSNVCSIFLWAKITPHYHVCNNSKYNRCHGWSMSNIINGIENTLTFAMNGVVGVSQCHRIQLKSYEQWISMEIILYSKLIQITVHEQVSSHGLFVCSISIEVSCKLTK